MITADSFIAAAEELTVANLGGEAVILDLRSSIYYGVNEIGVRILELARQPRSVMEIMDLLLQEYEVPADQLRRDVLAFLHEMGDHGLIRTEQRAAA